MDERYIEIIKRAALQTDDALARGVQTGASQEEVTQEIFNSIADIPEFPEIEESVHMALQVVNVYMLALARGKQITQLQPTELKDLTEEIEMLRNFDARDTPTA